MPTKLEAEAAQTAAGILPRAIEVKAIADCTVPGRAAKYSIPIHNSSPKTGRISGCNDSINSGNKIKVQANTNKCKRQCITPAIMAWRDNLAPCKKNSKAMAKLVSHWKKVAPMPCAGIKVAANTTAIKIKVKLSNKIRKRNIVKCTIKSNMTRLYWI